MLGIVGKDELVSGADWAQLFPIINNIGEALDR